MLRISIAVEPPSRWTRYLIIRWNGNGNKLVGHWRSGRTQATAMLRAAEYVRCTTEHSQYSTGHQSESHPPITQNQRELMKSFKNNACTKVKAVFNIGGRTSSAEESSWRTWETESPISVLLIVLLMVGRWGRIFQIQMKPHL